jgi:hypothetical protein
MPMTTLEARVGRVQRNDKGAVLVEAAIILPVLLMMIFGIFEIGSLLKSYSGAANAVRAGGRMASVAGNDVDADGAILARMALETAGIPDGEIEYIVIWHATGTGELPPSACRPAAQATPNTVSVGQTGGAGVACNIYHRPQAAGGAFDMAQGKAANPATFYFGCSGSSDPAAGHKLDCNWPGRDRKATVTPRGSTPPVGQSATPDYVGIYVRSEHNYVTGVLGRTITITDASVSLIEPQGYSVTS